MGSRRLKVLTRRWADDDGFSLIEMIVAIAVLAVIITPLTVALVTMLQRTRAVDDQISRSADAQRIGAAWTTDVQNVDIGGVNGAGTCPSATGGAAVEVHLVTFSWDRSASAGGTSKSASWVVQGLGEDMQLIRRYCENDVPQAETLLADRIGIAGASTTDVVHGPVPGDPLDFCPRVDKDPGVGERFVSDTCTIVVDGDFSYELSVTRRVPERDPAASPDTTPPPPTIDSATGRNTYITVVWTAPPPWDPPVDGYRAHVFTDPDGTPVGTVDLDGTSNSADFGGLTNGTPYFIRVQSHNTVGWGVLSAAYGPVEPQPTAPDAPTVLSVTPGDTEVTVTWDHPGNDGGSAITGWRLYAVGASTGEVGPLVVGNGSATSATITGLTNADSYRVSLEAVNDTGIGLRSDPSDPVVPYGIPGPAVITSVSQLPDGKVRITWTPPAANGPNAMTPDGGRPIEGYRVERASGPGSSGPWPSSSTWTSAGTTQLDVDGLTLGEAYTFRVLTQNARGHSTSDPSSPVVAASQPDVPVVVAAQDGPGAILVSWTPPPFSGAEITHYVVTLSPNAPGSGSPRTVNAPATSTRFTGLTSGTTYTFTVVAHNSAGASSPGTASARALGQPTGPVGVSVSRQPGNSYPFAVNVSWSRPSNDGGGCISAYRVEYSTNGSTPNGGSQTLNASPNPACGGEPGTSLGWTNLPAGVLTRYFRVVAVNTGGQEGASGWASIQMYQECSVTATEDGWVNHDHWGGIFGIGAYDYRGTNYGGDHNLRVHKDNPRLYVKFDPRSSGGSACSQFAQQLPSSAVVSQGWVHIHNNSPTVFNRDHTITRVTGGWAEGTLTWNNRPGFGGNLDYQSAASGGWREFAIPSADVQAQRSDATRFGFNIRDTGGNGLSSEATYSSRETGNKPYLRIRFY